MSTSPHSLLYRERLGPGLGLWIACMGAGVASFFVGAPINIWAGVVAGILVFLLLLLIFYTTAPIIEISQTHLQVGRARIERSFVGQAEAFRGEDARLATGPALDGRAYMCFRGWIGSVVRIEILDKADPTPYWIASSRKPEEIARILNQSQSGQAQEQ